MAFRLHAVILGISQIILAHSATITLLGNPLSIVDPSVRVCISCSSTDATYAIYIQPKSCPSTACAEASYRRALLFKAGWTDLQLDVPSGINYGQSTDFYSVGLAEGCATAFDVAATLAIMETNWRIGPNSTIPSDLLEYAAVQQGFISRSVREHASSSFWRGVGDSMMYSDGIRDGFNSIISAYMAAGGDSPFPPIDKVNWYLFQSYNDISAIVNSFTQRAGLRAPSRDRYPRLQRHESLHPAHGSRHSLANASRYTHCSAIVFGGCGPSADELIFGHATWFNYTSMLRTMKTVTVVLPAATDVVPANTNLAVTRTLSGYPGLVASSDDFYLIRRTPLLKTIAGWKRSAPASVLGVQETSLSFFDLSVFAHVTPSGLPYWLRVESANLVAHSGDSWVELFSTATSGTYNNQWMVIDLLLSKYRDPRSSNNHTVLSQISGGSKKRHRQAGLGPYRDFCGARRRNWPLGTLTVLEEVPGLVVSADVTEILNVQGFWPSYNIAFFPEINRIAGYPLANRSGADPSTTSYFWSARARIFRHFTADLLDADKIPSNSAKLPLLPVLHNYSASSPFTAPSELTRRIISLLRENMWKSRDSSVSGNPTHAIASRFDLANDQEGGAACYGALDAKVTSTSMALAWIFQPTLTPHYSILAVSGPSHADGASTPVFDFSDATSYCGELLSAMPHRWNFGTELFVYNK